MLPYYVSWKQKLKKFKYVISFIMYLTIFLYLFDCGKHFGPSKWWFNVSLSDSLDVQGVLCV